MSIDTAIADLMTKLDGVIASLDRNSTLQAEANALRERLAAGQQQAVEKMESAKSSGTRTPRAKKTDDVPGVVEGKEAGLVAETRRAAADKPKTETKPKAAALPKDADELKVFVSAWTGGTDDADERAARVQFLKDIAAELGVAPKFAELAGAEDGIKKTVFFINRKKEGLKVDFGADYDLDGDPAQDAAGNEDGGASDDDF